MHIHTRNLVLGLVVGGALAAAVPALSQDVRARVHVGPGDRPHAAVHVDRFHRVPPDIRLHGFRSNLHVRVSPFHRGWRVARFTPHERALWVRGHWWHGRHFGRFGWWWWLDGGWYFYDTPIYPYPDYVSDTYYAEPSGDDSNYWYYCRDPEGYYPYVQRCNGAWEPVPAQPEGGGYGDRDNGPDQDEMGPDESGPPDQGPPDDYGPGQGPPDEQGPPDDQGPPDEGPPPR